MIYDDIDLSFADCAFKLQRRGHQKYLDPRLTLSTSNLCERLLYEAGYAFGERRKVLLPSKFESQMFLNVIAAFWGLYEVSKILGKLK